MSHIRSVLALLPVALALAACGQTSTPTTTPTSKELVTVTLKSPFSQKVTAQGLPGLNGNPIVNHFKVKLYKHGETTPLWFSQRADGSTINDDNGTTDHLTFDLGEGDMQVLLPQGDYDIESIGKTSASEDGVFIAYGINDGVDGPDEDTLDDGVNISGPTPIIKLELHTLVSDAEFYWQGGAPESVNLGEQHETMLTVFSPTYGDDEAVPVPSSDYTVQYSVDEMVGGAVDSSSKLGAVFTTPAENPEAYAQFVAKATVSGWIAVEGEEKAVQGSITKTLMVDFAAPELP